MLIFYVVLAGRDKVTDAGRATSCSCKVKAPSLQQKVQKKDIPKKWVLTGKQFEDLIRKTKEKQNCRLFKKSMEHKDTLKVLLNKALVSRKRI